MKKLLSGTLVLAVAPFVFAAQQTPTPGSGNATQETQKPHKKKRKGKHTQEQTPDQTQQQSGQSGAHAKGHKGGHK